MNTVIAPSYETIDQVIATINDLYNAYNTQTFSKDDVEANPDFFRGMPEEFLYETRNPEVKAEISKGRIEFTVFDDLKGDKKFASFSSISDVEGAELRETKMGPVKVLINDNLLFTVEESRRNGNRVTVLRKNR